MLKRGLTTKGPLSAQEAAEPPSQTEATLWSVSFSPVCASQAEVGWFTLPLFGQEQLGLQQSQYPVVQVPCTQLWFETGGGTGVGTGAAVGLAVGAAVTG